MGSTGSTPVGASSAWEQFSHGSDPDGSHMSD
jgi:hypothetical protein